MIEQVVKPVIPAHLLDEQTRFLINPTGRFVIGGPKGDSGLKAVRLLSTPMGAMPATVAVPSLVRMRRKWTGQLVTWLATLPRIS